MNFFITSPHSGEKIPEGAVWLTNLPEPILMSDVDRYIDEMYEPIIKKLNIFFIKSQWHRYAADLNRLPEDVDCDSVHGHINPSGTHSDGLHWVKTKNEQIIMSEPMSQSLHKEILENCYFPFHQAVKKAYAEFLLSNDQVYHLDVHSMPSLGTKNHRDPGESRAQVVISDQDGKSCSSNYFELVCESYKKAGFEIKQNWPYKGGRITETYGQPSLGQNCVQAELNRSLYMDETTKKRRDELFSVTKEKIDYAIEHIFKGVSKL